MVKQKLPETNTKKMFTKTTPLPPLTIGRLCGIMSLLILYLCGGIPFMRKIHALTAAVLAVLMLCVMPLASCANQKGDPDAINDYTPEVMTIKTDKGVFTFENGEGDTAILVSYAGKATSNDEVEIPSLFNNRRVVEIGAGAFYHLSSIVKVTIPETVQVIGDNAFAACTELPSVTLPAGLTSISQSAFAGCTKLTTVDTSACTALKTVGDKAFWGCTALTDISLPSTLESIGDAAFWNCTALKTLTLPTSLTTLGTLAYYNCTGLESIRLTDSLENIGSFAFVLDGSTLKDKIDTSSLTNEKVLKYVADMKDPTVVETETAA